MHNQWLKLKSMVSQIVETSVVEYETNLILVRWFRYFPLITSINKIKKANEMKLSPLSSMSSSLAPPLPSSSTSIPLLNSPNPKSPPSISFPKTQQTHDLSSTNSKPISLRSRLSHLCKTNNLNLARRILDSLPHPIPTPLYNTLLIAYLFHSLPLQTLSLYSLMNSSSVPSDHYSYSSALTAAANANLVLLGRSIHCHIIRNSPAQPKNPILNNSILSMYASSRCFRDALLLFDRMTKRNVVSWNIMISMFVQRNQPDKALGLFKRMVETGIRLTAVSFINVFPAVALSKSKKLAHLIYGMLVKCGEEYVNDMFVVSSGISMFAEMFDVESARLVFDVAKRRNVEIWNTMIGGYVQNEEFEVAVRVFVEILGSDEVKADCVTFVNCLMAVSLMMNVRLGQQIHGYLMKRGSKSLAVIVYNALIVMYSRCGCIQLAFDLFQQMPERDIVTWNTMVSAFVQKDLNLEGVLLVYEMQKHGFLVDSVTVSALLSAASNLGNLRIGKETHGYLIRNEIECEGMESYLIDMYSKSHRVEIARLLFDVDKSKERDQVTWNAMIAGYMQNDQTEEALNLFRNMISKENQTPNSATLSSILPACDPIGGVQMGKEIHTFAIRRFIDKNIFVGTALVDMYSRCGEILSAERVFEGMEEKNIVTYTTMLSGFGQHGLGERALSLFQAMKESDIKPDSVTFVALLSACSYSGLVDEGLSLYESMKEYKIVTTQEHSCCVVDMLGRAGRVEEAYEFVQNLEDDNNNIGIWGSLLAACRVNQKFELAKLVSDRLFELETRSDLAGYHVLLSNVYAAEGKWEDVNWVRKEMREKGLRKAPGLSWIDVGDASHKFMSRDQKHPENDQIYAMLEELGAEMRLSGSKHVDAFLVQGVSQVE